MNEPTADDFERWGLLTRNPAPNAAPPMCPQKTVEMVIGTDGKVRPVTKP